MNQMKLKARLIDLGVAEEESTIIIQERNEHETIYINILGSLDLFQSFYYNYGKLIFIRGENITPRDVEIMSKLDLEEFE